MASKLNGARPVWQVPTSPHQVVAPPEGLPGTPDWCTLPTMLQRTFCHLPGVSPARERQLWDAGFHCWSDLAAAVAPIPGLRRPAALALEESSRRYAAGDSCYFARMLAAREQWRLLPEYPGATAYLDIETTGLNRGADVVTTIALFDGKEVRTFVQGENLAQFPAAVAPFKLLVTYNGKCFDLPFLEASFGLRFDQAHLDLRYVLHSLGLRGGLKGCERQLGIGRHELAGVDGFFAVLLWQDYCRTGNRQARETLLAYNIADTVNLATLAVHAYNRKLEATPFATSARLPLPPAPPLPHAVTEGTVLALRRRLCGF